MTNHIKESVERFEKKFTKKQSLLDVTEENPLIIGSEPQVSEVKDFLTSELKRIALLSAESMVGEEKELVTGKDLNLTDGCYCDRYEECTICQANTPIIAKNQAIQEQKQKLADMKAKLNS